MVATHYLHLARLSSADVDDEGTTCQYSNMCQLSLRDPVFRYSDILLIHHIPGFLPTFGPAYINFYGAPREATTFSSDLEPLNMGIVSILRSLGALNASLE